MKIIFSLMAASALFVLASSANAEQVGAPRDAALSQLAEQFEEKVFGRGLAVNGTRMLELFVSVKGTWTLLVSDPKGHSCIMASGQNWQGHTVLAGDPA